VQLLLVTKNIGFNTKENVVHIAHNARMEKKLHAILTVNMFASRDFIKEVIAVNLLMLKIERLQLET